MVGAQEGHLADGGADLSAQAVVDLDLLDFRLLRFAHSLAGCWVRQGETAARFGGDDDLARGLYGEQITVAQRAENRRSAFVAGGGNGVDGLFALREAADSEAVNERREILRLRLGRRERGKAEGEQERDEIERSLEHARATVQ
jgi:hypothetical protein